MIARREGRILDSWCCCLMLSVADWQLDVPPALAANQGGMCNWRHSLRDKTLIGRSILATNWRLPAVPFTHDRLVYCIKFQVRVFVCAPVCHSEWVWVAKLGILVFRQYRQWPGCMKDRSRLPCKPLLLRNHSRVGIAGGGAEPTCTQFMSTNTHLSKNRF